MASVLPLRYLLVATAIGPTFLGCGEPCPSGQHTIIGRLAESENPFDFSPPGHWNARATTLSDSGDLVEVEGIREDAWTWRFNLSMAGRWDLVVRGFSGEEVPMDVEDLDCRSSRVPVQPIACEEVVELKYPSCFGED